MPSYFLCRICGKSYISKKEYNSDMCPTCISHSKVFNKRAKKPKVRHMYLTYQCKNCGNYFQSAKYHAFCGIGCEIEYEKKNKGI